MKKLKVVTSLISCWGLLWMSLLIPFSAQARYISSVESSKLDDQEVENIQKTKAELEKLAQANDLRLIVNTAIETNTFELNAIETEYINLIQEMSEFQASLFVENSDENKLSIGAQKHQLVQVKFDINENGEIINYTINDPNSESLSKAETDRRKKLIKNLIELEQKYNSEIIDKINEKILAGKSQENDEGEKIKTIVRDFIIDKESIILQDKDLEMLESILENQITLDLTDYQLDIVKYNIAFQVDMIKKITEQRKAQIEQSKAKTKSRRTKKKKKKETTFIGILNKKYKLLDEEEEYEKYSFLSDPEYTPFIKNAIQLKEKFLNIYNKLEEKEDKIMLLIAYLKTVYAPIKTLSALFYFEADPWQFEIPKLTRAQQRKRSKYTGVLPTSSPRYNEDDCGELSCVIKKKIPGRKKKGDKKYSTRIAYPNIHRVVEHLKISLSNSELDELADVETIKDLALKKLNKEIKFYESSLNKFKDDQKNDLNPEYLFTRKSLEQIKLESNIIKENFEKNLLKDPPIEVFQRFLVSFGDHELKQDGDTNSIDYYYEDFIKSQIAVLLMVENSNFFMRAAKLKTIQEYTQRLNEYNIITFNQEKQEMPASCTKRVGGYFPQYLNPIYMSSKERVLESHALLTNMDLSVDSFDNIVTRANYKEIDFENTGTLNKSHYFDHYYRAKSAVRNITENDKTWNSLDDKDHFSEVFSYILQETANKANNLIVQGEEKWWAPWQRINSVKKEDKDYIKYLTDTMFYFFEDKTIEKIKTMLELENNKRLESGEKLAKYFEFTVNGQQLEVSNKEKYEEDVYYKYGDSYSSGEQNPMAAITGATSQEARTYLIDPEFLTGEFHEVRNYNLYLQQELQRIKSFDWKDLLSDKTKDRIKNRSIFLVYPELSASEERRRWGYRMIFSAAENALENGTEKFFDKVYEICNDMARDTDLCKSDFDLKKYFTSDSSKGKKVLENIVNLLKPLTIEDQFVPKFEFDRKRYLGYHEFFKKFWFVAAIKDNYEPYAPRHLYNVVSEFDYLENQLQEGNKWAILRLTFLTIMDRAKSLGPEGRNAIIKLFRVLKLNTSLRPFHGDLVLDKEERRIIWHKILKKLNKKSQFLLDVPTNYSGDKFNARIDEIDHDEIDYYELFGKIYSLNIFTQDNPQDSLEDITEFKIDDDNFREFVADYENDPAKEAFSTIKEIWEHRGDSWAQFDIISDASTKHINLFTNIDETQDDSICLDEKGRYNIDSTNCIKSLVLYNEGKLKAPYYRQSLLDATVNGKKRILDRLDYLCKLDHLKDSLNYQELFHGTSGYHDKLVEEYKIEKIPAKVQERMSDWTSYDKKAFWWSMGSMAFFLLLMAPVAPLIATGFALTIVGIGSYVATVEYAQYEMTRVKAANIAKLSEDGMNSYEGVDEIKTSIAWTIMEVAFAWSPIGILGRTGAKGIRSFNKAFSKEFFKQTSKAREALTVLGHRPHKNATFKKILAQNKRNGKNLLTDDVFWKNMAKKMTGVNNLKSVSWNQADFIRSPKFIDRLFANRIAEITRSPKNMKSILQGYIDKKIPAIHKKIQKLKIRNPESAAEQLSFRDKIWKAYYSKTNKLFGKFKMDVDSRITKLEKFIQKEIEIKDLIKELDNIPARDRKAYIKYLEKNADRYSSVFRLLPFRKRELFRKILVEDGPIWNAKNSVDLGLRNAIWARMNFGQLMRMLASARDVARHDHLMYKAFKDLGLDRKTAKDVDAFEIFAKEWKEITYKAYKDMDEATKKAYIESMDTFEKQITQKIRAQYAGMATGEIGVQLAEILSRSDESLQRILFYPKNELEEYQVRAIWNSVEMKEYLNVDHMENMEHQVIDRLSNFKTSNELEVLIKAMKIRLMRTQPEIHSLEIGPK